ncbi:MAG TPA: serine/threonine-protein kinase, partial [Myxococcales bacterium]|nr:serine/threonine-protein kinase [Myxococcales bacterium]
MSDAPSQTDPPAPTPGADLWSGARVGRFTVLEKLGSGGMSTVWSAFDPKLDRLVALKFLKERPAGEGPSGLLREAQVLAQLSHPNVVAVHDVDTHDGRVFMALELVRGQSLRGWLKAPRPWRAVVRVLVEAGRGLAAAHQAGIVHRDFKPANVLVGEDGRVRVTDFGLARAAARPALTPTATPALPPLALQSGVEDVTERGFAIGTRGYMSPEQERGELADSRSDQFSFCVTAYEALCGIRPDAAAAPTATGTVDSEAPTVPVQPLSRPEPARLPGPRPGFRPPRRVLRVVARGLRREAGQRWGSMPELLEALDQASRRLRPVHLVAGAAALVVVAAAAAGPLSRRCSGGDQLIQEAWRPPDRAWLGTSFAAAAPEDPGAAGRAADQLDAYALGWAAAYRDTCRAAERGGEAAAVGALRLSCLEARREEARAVVELFRRADRRVVEKSADAVLGLPGVQGCAEVQAFPAPQPLPDDPRAREQIEELSRQLARIAALYGTGDYPAAAALAEPLSRQAEQTGFAPLQARAQLQRGSALMQIDRVDQAREVLTRAFTTAERARDDATRATAAARLGYLMGHLSGKFSEADAWLDEAIAVSERASSTQVSFDAHVGMAVLRLEEGRPREALEQVRATESMLPRLPGGAAEVNYRILLSDALMELGKNTEAIRPAEEAVALSRRIYGDRHQRTARTEYALGRALVYADRFVEGRAHVDTAAEIFTARSGPDARVVLQLSDLRVTAFQGEGRFKDALEESLRTLERKERLLGKDHMDLAFTLDNLGYALEALGRLPEAVDP